MESGNKPKSRTKKVVSGGKGVEIYGEGLGTGPVGNTGEYRERKEQGKQQPSPAKNAASGRPDPFGQIQRPGQRPMTGQTPRPSSQGPEQRPFDQASRHPPAGQTTNAQRPGTQSSQRPIGQAQSSPRPTGQTQSTQRPHAVPQAPGQIGSGQRSGAGGTQRSSGGGKSPLLLIILAVVALLGGGSLTGLFGGNEEQVNPNNTAGGYTSTYNQSANTVSDYVSSGGAGGNQAGVLENSDTLSNLLSSFLGGSGSSVYDFTGSGSSLSGGSSYSSSVPSTSFSSNPLMDLLGGYSGVSTPSIPTTGSSSSTGSSSGLDTTVSKEARAKRTVIKGNGKDTVTLMVYLCGTDLESQYGMGTSDLKEMAKATLSERVNLIVYTGGCSRWRNSVVSSSTNQIYQIRDGGLYCLEKNMGTGAMTDPNTLAGFIQYGKENFLANRMGLILWDHGGGSISGYGYDEKTRSRTAMNLGQLRTALKQGGVSFDFIGFDACLMATVETGLMLDDFSDYLIASEETEPGVGWYYTNWLNRLSENTSMSTVEIGKMIADDFVAVCAQQCRGQGTTLSVIDLAELSQTVPSKLTAFSKAVAGSIKEDYTAVSRARGKTREFAQSSKIDQVDLVHFAMNIGTTEAKKLAEAVRGAVKYNRVGGGMTNANGLSIYFPYRQTRKVSQAVSAYSSIGMDAEYSKCIQEFASMEVSGQVAAGTTSAYYSGSQNMTGMDSLFGSLLGGGSGSSSAYGSMDSMESLLGSIWGGGSGGTEDLFSFFGGRSLTTKDTAQYLMENHFDAGLLVWKDGKITLPQSQWDLVESLKLNVFFDNGKGYVDLGMDSLFTIEENSLLADFDGTWISVDGQPIAYYYLSMVEGEEETAFLGYSPCYLNGTRVNLMIVLFSGEREGFIAGAEKIYANGETNVEAKNLIRVGKGDELQFICDYYDYQGNYSESYLLGKKMTLGDTVGLANTDIGIEKCRAAYCFTDLYQQNYWTPVME